MERALVTVYFKDVYVPLSPNITKCSKVSVKRRNIFLNPSKNELNIFLNGKLLQDL